MKQLNACFKTWLGKVLENDHFKRRRSEDNIKMDRGQVCCDVDETGSGSRPLAVFGITLIVNLLVLLPDC
jgi:hypothetical protein